jgi:hypothetical protein
VFSAQLVHGLTKTITSTIRPNEILSWLTQHGVYSSEHLDESLGEI